MRQRFMPTDDQIFESAKKFFDSRHKLPSKADSYQGLPQGSYSWAMILKDFATNHDGHTLADFMGQRGLHIPTKEKLYLPGFDKIAEAAYKICLEKNRLPEKSDLYEHLPQSSAAWTHILEKIAEEGKTITGIMEEYGYTFTPRTEVLEEIKVTIPHGRYVSEYERALMQKIFNHVTGRGEPATAVDVVSAVTLHFTRNNEMPTDTLLGIPTAKLSAAFASNKVPLISAYVDDDEQTPKTLEDFEVAAGLAVRQGSRLMPSADIL